MTSINTTWPKVLGPSQSEQPTSRVRLGSPIMNCFRAGSILLPAVTQQMEMGFTGEASRSVREYELVDPTSGCGLKNGWKASKLGASRSTMRGSAPAFCKSHDSYLQRRLAEFVADPAVTMRHWRG